MIESVLTLYPPPFTLSVNDDSEDSDDSEEMPELEDTDVRTAEYPIRDRKIGEWEPNGN